MAIETKPSAYPEWTATTGSAGMEQPPSSLRAKGYDDTEKPWARHWNWLMNNIYLWLVFLWSYVREFSKITAPDGIYVYGASTGASASIATPTITFVQLAAGDYVVLGGRLLDTLAAGITTALEYTFTGADADDTWYFYLDEDGAIQMTTLDPSADLTKSPLYSVDWASPTLSNLVDMRRRPEFEDPAGSSRLLAADPTDALGATTKQYVDAAVGLVQGDADAALDAIIVLQNDKPTLAYAGWVASTGAQAADLGSFQRVGKSKGTITYSGSVAGIPNQTANLQVGWDTVSSRMFIVLPTGQTVDDYYPPNALPAGAQQTGIGVFDQSAPAVEGAGFTFHFENDAGTTIAAAFAFTLFKW